MTTKMRATGLVLVFCLGGVSWAAHAQSGKSREWLTWGGDIERTGWNRGESTLSKQNVGRLGLKWKTQIDKEVSIEIESGNSMLTTPLVAQGVRTPRCQQRKQRMPRVPGLHAPPVQHRISHGRQISLEPDVVAARRDEETRVHRSLDVPDDKAGEQREGQRDRNV